MPSIASSRVQPADQRQRLVQCRRAVEPEQLGPAPGARHRLDLIANVDFGGGILSGQHHAQSGGPAVTLLKRGNARRDILTNARRTRHTIQSSRYAFSPDAFARPKPTSPHRRGHDEATRAKRNRLIGPHLEATCRQCTPIRRGLARYAELRQRTQDRDPQRTDNQQHTRHADHISQRAHRRCRYWPARGPPRRGRT